MVSTLFILERFAMDSGCGNEKLSKGEARSRFPETKCSIGRSPFQIPEGNARSGPFTPTPRAKHVLSHRGLVLCLAQLPHDQATESLLKSSGTLQG